MLKLLYVFLAVLLLLPGVLAAGFTVYGYVRARAHAVAQFASPVELGSSTLIDADVGIGPLHLAFQPRWWAALLVLAGAALWSVGILCLLFLPAR